MSRSSYVELIDNILERTHSTRWQKVFTLSRLSLERELVRVTAEPIGKGTHEKLIGHLEDGTTVVLGGRIGVNKFHVAAVHAWPVKTCFDKEGPDIRRHVTFHSSRDLARRDFSGDVVLDVLNIER